MKKRIKVVGAVLLKDDKILAVRRSERMALPGLWEFPGGKIEPGEAPTTALQRELAEELKIHVAIGQQLTTTEHEYDFGIVLLTTYLATLLGTNPVLSEHSELRWLARNELFEVEWAPADVPTVNLLASGVPA